MTHATEQDALKAASLDLICFSHLRWNFVFQRPQHLLTRALKNGQRVFYFEEPILHEGGNELEIRKESGGPFVAVPRLSAHLSPNEQIQAQKELLDEMLVAHNIDQFMTWYYTPMALKFSKHLRPAFNAYDCMDQLSHFKGAPKEITILEQDLFSRADVVFTGGQSLYEAKRDMHTNCYPFPSSIDVKHFEKAKSCETEPIDQLTIPHPRLGYAGVIDERIDLKLLAEVADAKPRWHIVMIGPVCKIDPADLPKRPNIHYLGGKDYQDLPAYMSGWDIGILPFEKNDATKFISPTKTPEYLAAGLRVISTSIQDVVRPYGEDKLVSIADTTEEFVSAGVRALSLQPGESIWRGKVKEFLGAQSWDLTFQKMWGLIESSYAKKFQQTTTFPQYVSRLLGNKVAKISVETEAAFTPGIIELPG